jgi:hypothetical protein
LPFKCNLQRYNAELAEKRACEEAADELRREEDAAKAKLYDAENEIAALEAQLVKSPEKAARWGYTT